MYSLIRNPIWIAINLFFLLVIYGCSDKRQTPADITDHIVWLDGRTTLPLFPFNANPIYMFFNADWCKYSKAMDRDVFSRPEVIKYINRHFTPIWVMPDSIKTIKFLDKELTSQQLKEALKITAYPAHFFFSKTGELKGVRSGYIDLKEFKLLLKYMAEGYVDKYDFATFLSQEESEMDTVWGEF